MYLKIECVLFLLYMQCRVNVENHAQTLLWMFKC